MARQLIWTPRAIRQIDAIAAYIERSSGRYPEAVVGRFLLRMSKIPDQPGQGRRVPEYDGLRDYREVLVHSWRLIYRVEPDAVIVVAVFHGARDLNRANPFDV